MNNLPENWIECHISDIMIVERGASPRPIKRYLTDDENGINWIKIGDTEKNGKYIYSTAEKIKKEAVKKSRFVQEGDFLLSNSMSFGRPYILKISGCIHDGWLVLRPKSHLISIDFFYYLLSSQLVYQQFSKLAAGAVVKNLNSDAVRCVEIPLPPLAEQGRIVQKIEELFADIDAGIQNLKSVQDQIKLYRQSVLKSAFDSINKWKFVKDITDFIKIGPFGSMLHEADYVSNGIPLINPSHIKNLNIHPSSDKCVSLEKAEELSGFKLKQNDIILGRRGEMGRCAVVKQNEENWLCGTGSMFLRLKKDFFPPFYCLFLSSPRNISYLEKNAAGTTMKNLNEKIVANIPVPVPTLDEQERIVAEIEKRFERADELEKAVNAALTDSEKMKQAILKKAFRGELVEQNPDDEPAAVLLDRIRAERAAAPKSPKKGKRK